MSTRANKWIVFLYSRGVRTLFSFQSGLKDYGPIFFANYENIGKSDHLLNSLSLFRLTLGYLQYKVRFAAYHAFINFVFLTYPCPSTCEQSRFFHKARESYTL